ncbi:hypothetical protein BN903_35 [Halorubrum sp. AJ67]|nr:hypothetical protein BN903_35 [Halorubrum sp. AJ67]
MLCCLRRDTLLCPHLVRPFVINQRYIEGATGLGSEYSQPASHFRTG